jgi:hypothetical protein
LSPGDLEFVQVVAGWTAMVTAFAFVLVHDERHLTPEQLARAWPPQTRASAIFAVWLFSHWLFLLPCLLIHFVRTRGWVRGVELGVLFTLAIDALAEGAAVEATNAVRILGL